ncbi:unnamed protein product [Prorocentrum cordatum]|uniref:Protein-S-isoprenylcysteine O-methyltransferase n=1 Tax=Prorocentrum cordatum TaxID=2364126 RepID=A0ABN9UUU4_9DINO|nr:unnamed protein product [Polarella glacialis]
MTAALAKYHHKTPLTPFGIACCGLYAAYGVRLSTYVLRRQGEDSYLPKLEALQLKSDMMGVAGKFAIVAGVSFSQALYALPLTVAMSPSAARARPALRALGWAGVGISAVGLLIREHVADEQKLAGKREKPGAPVVDGLYSYCRHPNYRNLLFHCGISCMGVSGTPMQVFACVFPTFFMGFTLQNAAVRSDKEESYYFSILHCHVVPAYTSALQLARRSSTLITSFIFASSFEGDPLPWHPSCARESK